MKHSPHHVRHVRTPTHPALALLLVATQYADGISTWIGLHTGGAETLPLTILALSAGWVGLFLLKSALALALVGGLVLYSRTWPNHPRIGVSVASAFCLWMVFVVGWNMLHVVAHLG